MPFERTFPSILSPSGQMFPGCAWTSRLCKAPRAGYEPHLRVVFCSKRSDVKQPTTSPSSRLVCYHRPECASTRPGVILAFVRRAFQLATQCIYRTLPILQSRGTAHDDWLAFVAL